MKKLSKIFIIFVLAITLIGCGKVPVLKNGEEALVTTKVGDISVDDFYKRLKVSTKEAKLVLIDMVDELILAKKYPDSDEMKDYIKKEIEKLKTEAESYEVTFEYLYTYYGFKDQKELEEYLGLSYKRNKAINENIMDSLKDKEIENYYKENIKGDIKCKHILIAPNTLDGMTEEEIAQADADALALAKQIITKLKNGEDFDELAKKYSTDTSSGKKGGDLGWFNTGDMVADFEKAAYSLQKGKYTTSPVKTQFGYHIILKTDEKAKPKLEEIKSDIKETLASNKLSEDATLSYVALEKIRNSYDLKIHDDDLKKLYNEYMKQLKTQTTQ